MTEIRCDGNGHAAAVVLRTGAVLGARAVILCTGTYLTGQTIVGECIESSGPDGLHPANALTDSLRALGLPLRRVQDRHAAADTPGQCGLQQNGAAGGRPGSAALQL